MRVYELAKELGVSSKELLSALHDGGHSVSSHMALLTDQMQQYLEASFSKKQKPQKGVPPAVAPKALKRRQALLKQCLCKKKK